jgi:flagellar basal body-associated protein FliL
MYAALFRALPGPLWLRIILLVVLALAVLAVLVIWVFPFVDQFVNNQDVTVAAIEPAP